MIDGMARAVTLAAALAAPLLATACAAPGGADGDGVQPSGAPVASPSELVGLPGAEVESRIGAPSFVRRDAGAQVWQYAGRDCLLDLFLYRESGAFEVRHAELRRRENRNLDDRACLADALSRKS